MFLFKNFQTITTKIRGFRIFFVDFKNRNRSLIHRNVNFAIRHFETLNTLNCIWSIALFTAWTIKGPRRGGRQATSTSRPSHIILIFSSEPPRNPRPSIIMRISRWLGRENEENVARDRNFCCWPSFPRPRDPAAKIH